MGTKNSGSFKRGHAKAGGRDKGTPNKISPELKELALNFTIEKFKSRQFQEIFDQLSPKEKADVICKLVCKLVISDVNVTDEGRTSVEQEMLDRITSIAGGFNGFKQI